MLCRVQRILPLPHSFLFAVSAAISKLLSGQGPRPGTFRWPFRVESEPAIKIVMAGV